MVAPGFVPIAEASIREVRVTDRVGATIKQMGVRGLLEQLQRTITDTRTGATRRPEDLTKIAIYLAQKFRHETCTLRLAENGVERLAEGLSHELVLLNLLMLARIFRETGYCTALARKLDDRYLLVPEKYRSAMDRHLFSSEGEQAGFEDTLRIVQGPAKTLLHDMIIDYMSIDEEKLELLKSEISKGVLRIARMSKENYRFVAMVRIGNMNLWATEINLIEHDPMKILKIATELTARDVRTAHPVAIIENLGRVYYVTEEVKDSVTMAEALRNPGISDQTKNGILVEAGAFIREAEDKGIGIIDPNMTNIMVDTKKWDRLTLIDIAEIVIHKEGERGKANMTALLEQLPIFDRALVMQGYSRILQ
jgi:hypothetical protein